MLVLSPILGKEWLNLVGPALTPIGATKLHKSLLEAGIGDSVSHPAGQCVQQERACGYHVFHPSTREMVTV